MLTKTIFILSVFFSLFLTGCIFSGGSNSDSDVPPVAVGEDSSDTTDSGGSNELSSDKPAFLKMDDVNAFVPSFETSVSSAKNGVFSAATSGSLFAIKNSGEQEPAKYSEESGEEKSLVGNILKFSLLSEKYLALKVQLANRSTNVIVDLITGKIILLDSLNLNFESMTFFANKIFSYTSDFKSLVRVDLETLDVVTYLTLPDGKSFMSGDRFRISDANLWWGDELQTLEGSKNFRNMLIDRDFNVLVQIIEEQVGSTRFPRYFIKPNGDNGEVTFLMGEIFSFTQADDRLYAIDTKSGHYQHLHPSSPLAQNADITISEVKIGASGMVLEQLQQFFPYSASLSADSKYKRCRDHYQIDFSKRYMVMGGGVLSLDWQNNLSPLSFREVSGNMHFLNSRSDAVSNSCFIVGDHLYYRSADEKKVMRFSLINGFTDSEEEVVSSSESIESFYVADKWIYFSTSSASHWRDLNDLNTDLDLPSSMSSQAGELIMVPE